ncbi:hypothetical protein CEXT_437841 [Caerostris extrusa]|uniref:Uncharacterized protein n=1 Tax=Caerostris extrusa TaxID=172846 RepID=A0AAV4WF08_CAEEX|nr:hypothetical protein CEXT_437841 [Caerostris extrusa]
MKKAPPLTWQAHIRFPFSSDELSGMAPPPFTSLLIQKVMWPRYAGAAAITGTSTSLINFLSANGRGRAFIAKPEAGQPWEEI